MKTPAKPVPYTELLLERLADRVVEKLRPELHQLASRILKGLKTMSVELDAALATLTDDVTKLTTVDASAVAMIQGLADQLKAALDAAANAGATPAQLQALSDLHTAISAQDDALAAAVTANTAPAPAA
jgi:ABC-type transporter Mla MlaB component